MTVTYGQLRRYLRKAEAELDRRELGGRDSSRDADCVRSLGNYLAHNPDAQQPDAAVVDDRTLEYYRYPGFEGEE